ncbi:hypothetical protein D3C87_989740 [compost metagenome]
MYDIYEDNRYKLKITLEDGLPFFHVDVKCDLTKKDIKEGRVIFDQVKDLVVNSGYERLYAYTPKIKFAKLLGPGFIHLQEIVHDGITLDVIVWELLEDSDGS